MDCGVSIVCGLSITKSVKVKLSAVRESLRLASRRNSDLLYTKLDSQIVVNVPLSIGSLLVSRGLNFNQISLHCTAYLCPKGSTCYSPSFLVFRPFWPLSSRSLLKKATTSKQGTWHHKTFTCKAQDYILFT